MKKTSTILLILLFISPVLATLLMSIGQTPEANQYNGLQWIIMGIYNMPFVITSLIADTLGNTYIKKQNEKVASTWFLVSVTSSIVGIILMFSWSIMALAGS